MNIRTLPLYVTARACPAAAMLTIAVVVEKRFGALVYGEFSTIFSFSLSASAFFFGWIVQAISRFSNGTDDFLHSTPQAFSVSWVFSSVAVTVTALIVSLFTQYWTLAPLVATAVCCQGLHLIAIAIHQTRFKSTVYFALEAFRSACICFCSIGVGMLLNRGLEGLVLGFSAGMLVDAIFALLSIRNYRLVGKCDLGKIKINIKEIFGYGWAISIWLSLSLAIPFIDRSVLRGLGGGVLMGRYAFEYDIVFRAFTFILLPVTISSQPAIFKAHAEGNLAKISGLLKAAILAQMSLGIGFAAVLYLLIFFLLPLKDVFLNVDPAVFLVLCVSALFWQMALVSHKLMECEKKILLMVKIFAASYFILGLCPAVLLFEYFGLPGFAAGNAAGGAGYCLIAFGFSKKIKFGIRGNFSGV
ncbi:hypothetical protein [Paraburkholderia sp. RL17-337-BIB-A]|uniref:hypothetical protein n=1 Tax=Paraburkholderia sp. RL17-337-BIB-A TaxID=3031636 RepID=UPI0038B86BF1